MNSNIKKNIRQRKRLYRNTKQVNTETHWSQFRTDRKEVVLLLRNSKKAFFSKTTDKLKSSELCAKDWWKTLRTIISPDSNRSIPPLYDEQTNTFVDNDFNKTDILNNYFASQSLIDEPTHGLPPLQNECTNTIQSIHISPDEVIDAIKCLKLGKASGPDTLDNRILKEAMHDISTPLCDFSA